MWFSAFVKHVCRLKSVMIVHAFLVYCVLLLQQEVRLLQLTGALRLQSPNNKRPLCIYCLVLPLSRQMVGGKVKKPGKRGRKPAKIDLKAKLERSRQSARECRARKKLRYQYLEELVSSKERAICALREELEMVTTSPVLPKCTWLFPVNYLKPPLIWCWGEEKKKSTIFHKCRIILFYLPLEQRPSPSRRNFRRH